MMHGREKSDSAIVAEKPTNKAVPTAAEPVERRVEAKGNANQQSTDRAQNRATVSQALERIRKVAKERKKERFTALFHHISIDLLDEAFYELKENAAAGVDRLTWTDYEADLDAAAHPALIGVVGFQQIGGTASLGIYRQTVTGIEDVASLATFAPIEPP